MSRVDQLPELAVSMWCEQRWHGLAIAWGILSFGWCHPAVVQAQSAAPKIDFNAHIRPIFKAKCIECHNEAMQSGGVRLDVRTGAMAGGYSRQPLLGGTLETNEIYRRVSSDDVTYRMPKGKPPLTQSELDLMRRWVEEGTPWPRDPLTDTQLAERYDWFSQEAWLNYGERWLTDVPGFIYWLYANLGLLFVLWFIERYRLAARLNRPWINRRGLRWLAPLRNWGIREYLLMTMSMTGVLVTLVMLGMQAKMRLLQRDIADVQRTAIATQNMVYKVYGDPPKPIRPHHEPRLAGYYYRGNCERNMQLFNGGNYRTATLHVGLIDAQGKPVNYGDRVAPDSLSVRFELERAKGTTDVLFGDSIAKGVFLTRQHLTDTAKPLSEPVIPMRVVTPGWKWEAVVPLDGPHDELVTTLSGLVYVYQGMVERGLARGTLHYGIQYDLHFKNLVLEPKSEVWMGSLYWTPVLEVPSTGKIPLKQWFDDQPIPEITGKNSTDPKLLGIPEHLQKK